MNNENIPPASRDPIFSICLLYESSKITLMIEITKRLSDIDVIPSIAETKIFFFDIILNFISLNNFFLSLKKNKKYTMIEKIAEKIIAFAVCEDINSSYEIF